MTRCAKFHHLFDEVGDFCGMSPTAISHYKAYREQVKKLVNLGIEEDFVFENFPEGPGRILSAIKDDETRIKALNYVASCLTRKERVTENDLRTTLKGWNGDGQKPCSIHARSEKLPNGKSVTTDNDVKPIAPLHPTLGDRVRKEEMAEAEKNQPAPVEEPEPVVVPPPRPPTPAPCTLLKQCPDLQSHVILEKVRGRVCDVLNIPINQLPGPDKECPLEKKERLKNTPVAAFVRASTTMDNLDAAKPIKPAPYVVKKALLTDGERDTATDALIERTRFTRKDVEQIDELVKVNREGWACRFDLIEAAVMMLLAKAEGA